MFNYMKFKELTVNYHLTKACNMRCKFCYATFTDLGCVKHDYEKSVQLIHALARAGFGKITFAGGEPTLVRELPALVKLAKSLGMTTCVVTNGSRLLNDGFVDLLAPHLDWLALSIDSLDEAINMKSGRKLSGDQTLDADYFEKVIAEYRKYGVKIKINTVVSQYNVHEDLNVFILRNKPNRWKVLQATAVEGQNSDHTGQFEVSDNEFDAFIQRHYPVENRICTVPEESNLIRGSYVMVSPDGCFFDSSMGYHTYSNPILQTGVEAALQQIHFDFEKFKQRGGIYDLKKNHTLPKVITFSGEVGSGKSSAGKILAQLLGYTFHSLGNSARERAREMGMGIVEFQSYCQQNPEYDQYLDIEFASKCNGLTNAVIDFRMGYKFIPEAFHVFLKVGAMEAARRLNADMREGENTNTIEQRNFSFKNQFNQNYGEDYTNENHYHLVIDTEKFNSPYEVAVFIIRSIKSNQ
ncbi:MAG: viperin family antiviral radical SAM protein [Bacteroidetes bacterium]|nr:viperin family antiviral radical SAM protein [Bacteroidota bacterium]